MSLVTNVIRGSGADRLLLLLHGYGADERDLGGILPYLDPEGHFVTVMPRGPLSAPPGFAWFDVQSDPETALAGATAVREELDDLVDATCAEHGLARAETIVAGFSQGAGLALALALSASDRTPLAGVLAMSPFVVPGGLVIDPTIGPEVPVLAQHGTEDPLVPIALTRQLVKVLDAAGVPVVFEEYPMAHQVALESMQAARTWLDSVRAGERPSAPTPEPVPEGPVKSVTTANFDTEVLASTVPVIVDFWAPWCGPCRQVGPIVEQIARMRGDAYKVVKVNIDEEPALAQRYEVQSIPLIGLFRNGRLERASLGAKPRPQLEAELGMLVIP